MYSFENYMCLTPTCPLFLYRFIWDQFNLNKFTISAIGFLKKFAEGWTAEVYIHAAGNEIGLIGQFWPTSVHHVKLIPTKEVDLLLSVKHDISKSKNCLKDSTDFHFNKCLKSRLKQTLINSGADLPICLDCKRDNISVCAIPQMSYFQLPGIDIHFCLNMLAAKCSFRCLDDTLR